MRRLLFPALCLLGALTAVPPAVAQEAAPSVGLVFRGIESVSEPDLQRAEALAEFGHPNELWRVRAMMAVKRGDLDGAVERLQMAARYADKLSQHSLALLYWHGIGVEKNPALAYAWSELAAERGYPTLERSRAAIWARLDADERAKASTFGPGLRAEYGDAVAKPRMERELVLARTSRTGSRLGSSINQVQVGSASGRRVAHQDSYYAEHRWDAETYWAGEDRVWKGKVVIGDSETVTTAGPDAEAGSEDND